MSRRIQELVNAQISINRAVFEGNKTKCDEKYIDECIASAQRDLADAAALKETKRRIRAAKFGKKAA